MPLLHDSSVIQTGATIPNANASGRIWGQFHGFGARSRNPHSAFVLDLIAAKKSTLFGLLKW